MNNEWWMMNDEWWMMNDEWWMMSDEQWWMMNNEWWIKVGENNALLMTCQKELGHQLPLSGFCKIKPQIN